jgi:hypothetical protein
VKDDCGWVAAFVRERWGTTKIVSRGRIHWADQLPGVMAMKGKRPVGLATYNIENEECELVTIDSSVEGAGIGSALIEAVKALRFYQKRGFCLKAVHRLALDNSRKLKPEIPLVGKHEIPLRDEIELEMPLWRWIGEDEPRKRGFAARFFHEHRIESMPGRVPDSAPGETPSTDPQSGAGPGEGKP